MCFKLVMPALSDTLRNDLAFSCGELAVEAVAVYANGKAYLSVPRYYDYFGVCLRAAVVLDWRLWLVISGQLSKSGQYNQSCQVTKSG
jgi:hypothetical protein